MSASYITYGARKLVTVPSNWVYSETLDSVTNSLNYIKVHKAFENSKKWRGVFFDISQEFDKVWYSGLQNQVYLQITFFHFHSQAREPFKRESMKRNPIIFQLIQECHKAAFLHHYFMCYTS